MANRLYISTCKNTLSRTGQLMGMCFVASVFSVPAVAATESAEKAMTEPAAAVGQVFVGLIVVVSIIVGLGWGLKKFGVNGLGAYKGMRVISTLAVGGRERVVLIDVEGQKILLGVSPGRVNYLQQVFTSSSESAPENPNVSEGNRHDTSVSSPAVESAKSFEKSDNDFSSYLKNILMPGNK